MMIHCKKLGKEAPALTFPPYPGELGKKLLAEISQPAWDSWLKHQTMLINEYKLSMLDAKSRDFLKLEMEKYLFGDGSAAPAGFTQAEE